MAKPALQQTEFDVARPIAVLPRSRAAGLYIANNDDVVYLWRQAHGYFERARTAEDAQAAERLRRMGTNFAVMAVALLQEIGQAIRQIDRPASMTQRS